MICSLLLPELSKVGILTLGFTAQLFFSLRTLFQWWKSEKAKKVVSPSAYWVLSVIGAYLMFIYFNTHLFEKQRFYFLCYFVF